MSTTAKAVLTAAEKVAAKLAMLPAAAKATKLTPSALGIPRWQKPKFSKRKLADLKKEALTLGLEWPMPEKPERPAGQSFHEIRIFFSKGHKYERQRPSRDEEIKKNMAEMPKKIEAWKETKTTKALQQTDLQRILTGNKTTY